MTIAVRPEILSSLQAMREDVQRRLAGLDRYRALKAIEQTIADFPALEDLTRPLSDIRDAVQRQLDETRECRALQTIERVMPELSEVVALLAESVEPVAGEPTAGIAEPVVPPAPEMPAAADALPELAPVAVQIAAIETIAGDAIPEAGPVQPGSAAPPPAERAVMAPEPADAGEPVRVPKVPSLADSVAQLLAQSAPPRDPPAAPDDSGEGADIAVRPPPHAERAA